MGSEISSLQERLKEKRDAFIRLRQEIDDTLAMLQEKTIEKRSIVLGEGRSLCRDLFEHFRASTRVDCL